MKYVIKNGKAVHEPNLIAWAEFMEDPSARRVAVDYIGEMQVSTVFLGVDHRLGIGGCEPAPILWETMIFGGTHDGYQERYMSQQEAEMGHKRAVELATKATKEQTA